MEIRFLTLQRALTLQERMIEEHGGEHGVRDMNLLQSALHMPTATFDNIFLHTDIYEMAGAYMYHLVKNHPFVDGNKRAGSLAAIIFLKMNGVEFTATNTVLADFTLELACGNKDKAEAAIFFKLNSKKAE